MRRRRRKRKRWRTRKDGWDDYRLKQTPILFKVETHEPPGSKRTEHRVSSTAPERQDRVDRSKFSQAHRRKSADATRPLPNDRRGVFITKWLQLWRQRNTKTTTGGAEQTRETARKA